MLSNTDAGRQEFVFISDLKMRDATNQEQLLSFDGLLCKERLRPLFIVLQCLLFSSIFPAPPFQELLQGGGGAGA